MTCSLMCYWSIEKKLVQGKYRGIAMIISKIMKMKNLQIILILEFNRFFQHKCKEKNESMSFKSF